MHGGENARGISEALLFLIKEKKKCFSFFLLPRRGTSRRYFRFPSTTSINVPWAGERNGGRKPLRRSF